MAHLFSITALALIAFGCRFLLNTWWSAGGVFAAVWGIFLLLHKSLAPDFLFSLEAGIIITVYISCAAIGNIIVVFAWKKHTYAREGIHPEQIVVDRRLRIIMIVMGVISLGGAIGYSTMFTSFYGSLHGLLTAGWSIRGDIAAGAIVVPLYIRMPMLLAYPCYCLALTQWVLNGQLRYIVLPVLSLFIMATSQAGRAGLLILCIMFFAAYIAREIYVRRRVRRGSLFLMGGVVATVILVIFTGGAAYRSQTLDILPTADSEITGAKSYAFGAASSFTTYLKTRNSEVLGLGAWSFASLFQALGLRTYEVGYYTDYLQVSSVNHLLTSNVYTVFRSAIDDFGIIGAGLYFLVVGGFLGYIFHRTLEFSPAALSQSFVGSAFLIYSVFAPLSQHTALLLCFLIPPIIMNSMTSVVAKPHHSQLMRGGRAGLQSISPERFNSALKRRIDS